VNSCEKCNGTKFQAGEMRGTGGLGTSLFNVQTEKFSYVACEKCGYTEFYKKPLSDLQKIFDFMAG
jgi:predicted nucleic-acid-binding Zn-ribbon protein